MPYTSIDAQENMGKLIARLQEKFNELFILKSKPGLSTEEKGEITNELAKLNQELLHRRLLAAFDTASATVIRPPTDNEVKNLQSTLEFMGKEINGIATLTAVITFVEEVMTGNAQRFNDILKTISI